jgi:hypothetical protein
MTRVSSACTKKLEQCEMRQQGTAGDSGGQRGTAGDSGAPAVEEFSKNNRVYTNVQGQRSTAGTAVLYRVEVPGSGPWTSINASVYSTRKKDQLSGQKDQLILGFMGIVNVALPSPGRPTFVSHARHVRGTRNRLDPSRNRKRRPRLASLPGRKSTLSSFGHRI